MNDMNVHAANRSGSVGRVPRSIALIAANLAAGHLLPRSLEDLEAHADSFHRRGTRDGAVIGCAELAPLSESVAEVRSLVVDEAQRGQRIGAALVTTLAGARAARRLRRRSARSRTSPSHFVRLGFSIVPHVWLPEKIAHDCVGCAQFRHCGQYAVSLPLRPARPAPERPLRRQRALRRNRAECRAAAADPVPAERGARAGMTVADIADAVDGGITAPAGFRAAGVACGIKSRAASTSRCSSSDAPASARRGLHDQQGAGGAGPGLAGAPRHASGGTRARSSSTAAAPTPAPARTGMRHARERWPTATARAARLRSRRQCSWPRPASSASTLDRTRSRDGISDGRRRARRAIGGARGRARDHDDRSVSEGSGGRGRRPPAGRFRVGGMAKGSGHDRADDGDDARRS